MKKLSSFLSKISFFALMSMLMATPISLQAIEANEACSSTTTVSKKTVSKKQRSKRSAKAKQKSASQGSVNGHAYVDLGLSVKWATCNVGADKPEDYGDYFAWGETSPKSRYDEDNCETCGKNVGDIGGDPRYDAARANWGGTWRMPTKCEVEELVNRCHWRWTTRNGVEGHIVKSKVNGNTIFLPAAGSRYGSKLIWPGLDGNYLSSTPMRNGSGANGILFSGDEIEDVDAYGFGRSNGRSIRPVTE